MAAPRSDDAAVACGYIASPMRPGARSDWHIQSLALRRGAGGTRSPDWERYLSDNGFRIVKILLNISKEEQRLRFLKRLDRLDKNWKFSSADIAERGYWDDYQRAFSEMLSHTSTAWAPWYVVPADHKWFAHICAAAVIVDALIEIDPRYPEVSKGEKRELAEARKLLETESPGK